MIFEFRTMRCVSNRCVSFPLFFLWEVPASPGNEGNHLGVGGAMFCFYIPDLDGQQQCPQLDLCIVFYLCRLVFVQCEWTSGLCVGEVVQAETPGSLSPSEPEEEVCVGLIAHVEWVSQPSIKKKKNGRDGMRGEGNFQRSTLKV